MGKDKYENEDLSECCARFLYMFWKELVSPLLISPIALLSVKYGLPEDCWFHVDDLSSAHVYLRLKPDMTLDDISDDLLLDCASLVKANSIEGCKVRSISSSPPAAPPISV